MSTICVKPIEKVYITENKNYDPINQWGRLGRERRYIYPPKEEQEAINRKFIEDGQKKLNYLKYAIDDIRMDPVPEHIYNSGPIQY